MTYQPDPTLIDEPLDRLAEQTPIVREAARAAAAAFAAQKPENA